MVKRLAAVTIGLCLAAGARAQPLPIAEPITQGIANPSASIAGDADASAIESNPALLGTLGSWSGAFVHSELSSTGKVGGRGTGFFFASPLPWISSIALGGAVQLVRPPDTFLYGNLAKISLALAWRPHASFSIGLHYAHLAGGEAPVASGGDTLDLAIAGRLGRRVGWGLVVRDLPAPTIGGVPHQRVYDPELALRPFGTDRLELAVGARFGERRGDIDPHFRLWAVAHKGIGVKADVEWRRDLDVDGRPENDVRVALGLQIDLERAGIAGFGLFGRDDGATHGQGFSLAARVSGERYRTFWRGPRYLERIVLDRDLRGRKLLALLDRLRVLERDDSAAGVVLIGGDLGCGFAGAEELRAAMVRLRKRGRHVLAFLMHADTKTYLAASAADYVVMDPAGHLGLTGAAVTLPYFKGTGELLGIRADYVRIGAYKGAPERYTRDAPSPEVRAAREAYLDDLERHLVTAIGAARSLDAASVRRRIDAGPHTPDAALAAGFVDEVRPGDELGGVIERVTGRVLAVHDAPRSPARGDDWAPRRVEVIHVEGDLVGGASREVPILGLRATGLVELATALERAIDDPRVRAVVLRIDSPGGSSQAADLLAREVERARARKPVVCSLGDTAASGGYWLASACDEIFAAPSTLAGSIGIYTGKLDFSGLLGKLGVSLTLLERGAHAGIDSHFRAYSDDERTALMRVLRYHYDRFVDAVARGRRTPRARVLELGEGRIYSGDRARSLGLVDHFGGLTEAIEAAARRGGAPIDAPIHFSPEPPTLLGQAGKLLGLPLKRDRAPAALPGLDELIQLVPGSLVFEPSAPQARLDP